MLHCIHFFASYISYVDTVPHNVAHKSLEVITIKLDYFTLLSPQPVYIPQTGNIRCPTLRDISIISYNTYMMYVSCLFNSYDALTAQNSTCRLLCDALNFFIVETVTYSENLKKYVLYKDNLSSVCGYIASDNYPLVADVILQRICLSEEAVTGNNVKLKNSTAARLLSKIRKGASKASKSRQAP